MQRRVRGQRISRTELIAESRRVLAEAGVGNNSRARFLSEVSGLVVGSTNPSFLQLQPTISQHDSDAWLRAYELVFRFLRENGLKATIGAVESEFGQGPLPQILTDGEDTGYASEFDSLLACIPRKLPFRQKVRNWMNDMRQAKRPRPAPPKEEEPVPAKPAQKKPLKRRKKSPKRKARARASESAAKTPQVQRLSPSKEDAFGSFVQLEPYDARRPPPKEPSPPRVSPKKPSPPRASPKSEVQKRRTPNVKRSPVRGKEDSKVFGFVPVEEEKPVRKVPLRKRPVKMVTTPKREADDLQDDFVIDLVIPAGSQ